MDRKMWNDHQIPVDQNKARFHPLHGAYQNSPGNRQRPVEPGFTEHASILFYIEFYISPVNFNFCIGLDPETG